MNHKLGVTKAELARQLGVSRAYITMIAHGKRTLTKPMADKIASLDVNTQLQIANPKSCPSASSGTSPSIKPLKYYQKTRKS